MLVSGGLRGISGLHEILSRLGGFLGDLRYVLGGSRGFQRVSGGLMEVSVCQGLCSHSCKGVGIEHAHAEDDGFDSQDILGIF